MIDPYTFALISGQLAQAVTGHDPQSFGTIAGGFTQQLAAQQIANQQLAGMLQQNAANAPTQGVAPDPTGLNQPGGDYGPVATQGVAGTSQQLAGPSQIGQTFMHAPGSVAAQQGIGGGLGGLDPTTMMLFSALAGGLGGPSLMSPLRP